VENKLMDAYQKYYLLITECDDLLLEAGEWKIVFRGGKKIKKLICPPGMKSVGKTCKRMGSAERKNRRKALKIAAKKAKAKAGRIMKKRAKAMKKRAKLGL
jgi:hypothetical protein